MTATPITVSELTQVGRTNVGDAPRPRITLSYQADFTSAADISFNFSNQEANTFGYAKSIFVDNSTNPSPVVIIVSTTQHKFTIPAYSEGVYQIETSVACTIRMVTDGGAVDNKATINFYNYVVPPQVYYSFGPLNTNVPLKQQGAMEENSSIASQPGVDNPVYIGGRDGSGIFRGIATDATGRLLIVGSGSGGQVYGPDANGAPPTQPPLLIAGTDAGGSVRTVRVNASGTMSVSGSVTGNGSYTATGSALPVCGTDGTNARIFTTDSAGRIIISPVTVVTSEEPVATTTRSSVSGTTSSTQLVLANANRKGVTIFNDSVAVLYIGIGLASVSTSDYTVQVQPGGYYEVPQIFKNQAIWGIWASATGSAKVTTGI